MELKVLEGDKRLSQCAWNYLNDSCRLDISLRYRAQDIACAAVWMAIQKNDYGLPQDIPWWNIMGSNLEVILSIAAEILHLYDVPKVRLFKLTSIVYKLEFVDLD